MLTPAQIAIADGLRAVAKAKEIEKLKKATPPEQWEIAEEAAKKTGSTVLEALENQKRLLAEAKREEELLQAPIKRLEEQRKEEERLEALARLKESIMMATKEWLTTIDVDDLFRRCHQSDSDSAIFLSTVEVCLFPEVIYGELPDIMANEVKKSPEYEALVTKCTSQNLICRLNAFQACCGPEIEQRIYGTPEIEGRNSIRVYVEPINQKEYFEYLKRP